ncbi:MAG: MBOAT family protein [Desulfovibrionaceae bacterium]|nr:MBOAT family protein [Desulfovibrionaceae bacterium]
MVFSSLPFIFFIFPLALAWDLWSRSVHSTISRNKGLFFISLLFYSWDGGGRGLVLLVFLGLFNFWGGLLLENARKRLSILILLIVVDLSVLCYYKYLGWIFSFISITHNNYTFSNHMPLGISFFTFHAISYVVDVYRNIVRAERSWLGFLTYFCMFPHLVAGPIVRYARIAPELTERGPDMSLFSYGVYRFCIGLGKKICIADFAAQIADTAFQQATLSCPDAWLGLLAYTMQIYFDFSGYSDMGIGLAAMLGFRFAENFAAPYQATSIRDFWRRWHMSLTAWLRDYLYIPLGGNRCGFLRTHANKLAVFLACGLWHGADVTFIIWGVWHGLFLLMEGAGLEACVSRLPRAVRHAYCLLIVMLGWVWFRADTMDHALNYFYSLFNANYSFSLTSLHNSFMIIIIGSLICCLPKKYFCAESISGNISFYHYIASFVVACLSLCFMVSGSQSPFLYFNF